MSKCNIMNCLCFLTGPIEKKTQREHGALAMFVWNSPRIGDCAIMIQLGLAEALKKSKTLSKISEISILTSTAW